MVARRDEGDLYPLYRLEKETRLPGALGMADHSGLGGMNRKGIMSGEEGANQWMSWGGVCMDMQVDERVAGSAMKDMSSDTIVVTIRSILIEISGPSARYAFQPSQTLDWLTVAANALQRRLMSSTARQHKESAGECVTVHSKTTSFYISADRVTKAINTVL